MTDEIVTQRPAESKAERMVRIAAAETAKAFHERRLPRSGFNAYAHGSWHVIVSEHPELAPLKQRFMELASAPVMSQQQMFIGGTR